MGRRPGPAGSAAVVHRVGVGLTATEYADLEAIAARSDLPLGDVLRLAVFGPGLRSVSWLGSDALIDVVSATEGRLEATDELILRRANTTDGRLVGPVGTVRTARNGYPLVHTALYSGEEPAWYVVVGAFQALRHLEEGSYCVARLRRTDGGRVAVEGRGPVWSRSDGGRFDALEYVGRQIALGRWV